MKANRERSKRPGPRPRPGPPATPVTSGGASWLPRDANPCVWMAAGLLSYKLCERDYDCEHCPLDAALAGEDRQRAEPPGEAERGWRARCQFRPDRSYHASHTWVQRLHGARVRCGLDVFAGHLLGRPSTVVLPPVNSRLRRGQPACWVVDDGETIPFRSPVSGTVLASNPSLRGNPALVSGSPYDDGWLLDVQCDAGLEDQPGLLSAGEMRALTARQLRKLHALESRARCADPSVGATLNDGGKPIDDLRGLLGERRYRRLVRELVG